MSNGCDVEFGLLVLLCFVFYLLIGVGGGEELVCIVGVKIIF